MPEQDSRIVVVFVDCDPGERAGVAIRPLRQQRGLAVAGRRHDDHERERARSAKATRCHHNESCDKHGTKQHQDEEDKSEIKSTALLSRKLPIRWR